MSDSFSEVSTTSWIGRIKNAIFGVLFGLVLFIASFVLIWWNEGRSVERIKTLQEGRDLVVSVSSDMVAPEYEGKLVHVSGMADTAEVLRDPLFGIQEQALKIKRTVEMYQWKEREERKTTENVGGSKTTRTTYHYDKVWSEDLIDSSRFKKSAEHENPVRKHYDSKVLSASDIHIGGYGIGATFVGKMSNYKPYQISDQHFGAMHPDLQNLLKVHDGAYFYGDPGSPEIGAMRIKYGIIKPQVYSIVGQQNHSVLGTYSAKNGDIALLETGTVNSDAMFSAAEKANALMTWGIRGGGFFLMFMGLRLFFGPLEIIASVIPFMGRIVETGLSLISGLIAAILTLLTIALAWVFYRPLIGGALLFVVVMFVFGGFRLTKRKSAPTRFTGESTPSKVDPDINGTLGSIVSEPVAQTAPEQPSDQADGEMGWNPENYRK